LRIARALLLVGGHAARVEVTLDGVARSMDHHRAWPRFGAEPSAAVWGRRAVPAQQEQAQACNGDGQSSAAPDIVFDSAADDEHGVASPPSPAAAMPAPYAAATTVARSWQVRGRVF
jgi:hypothetical protein